MSPRRGVRDDVRAALPAWLAARALTALAWVIAVVYTDRQRDGVWTQAMHQGLFAWDGAFYRDIAERGYGPLPAEAIRFFPLFPLIGRALGALVLTPGFWLVVVANVGALAAAGLLHRMCLLEGLGAPAARRAAVLVAIVPPSFVLVWAYAESVFLLLAIGALLAARRRRWWLAAALGFLAGLTRPTAALLAFGLGAEALRQWRRQRPGAWVARLAAVAAPVVGVGVFLWWAQVAVGDWRRPQRVQDSLRGGLVDPFTRVVEAATDLLHARAEGLHLLFALAILALCVVTVRRLPAGYSVFAIATVVVSLSAGNLNSIERYALNSFPLVVALALVLERKEWMPVFAAASSGVLVAMASLAWLQVYVP